MQRFIAMPGPKLSPVLARPTEADIALANASKQDLSAPGLGRRSFLQGSLMAGAAAGVSASTGIFDAVSAEPLRHADRILVTVFLNGGNDHLNTVIPAEDGAYHDARGRLAVSVDGSTSVGDQLHLHPSLGRLKARFDAGQVALVRGVGERTADKSHFSSIETWMKGTRSALTSTGWLGRYQDDAGLGELGAVSIGWQGIPLILRGGFSSAVGLPPHGYLFGANREEAWQRSVFDVFADLGGTNAGNGVFGPRVADTFASAVNAASTVAPAYTGELPQDGLARELALAAKVINLNVGTQLVHVNQSGFDTHEGQRPHHDGLMAELDAGIDAFFSSLDPQFAQRTCVLVFSEFGRRVQQTMSGTDHGTAGLMFLVGPSVRGGMYGVQPSLRYLDSGGDMRHHLDFRSVYASVLEDWLSADAVGILGSNYERLNLFAAGSNLGPHPLPGSTLNRFPDVDQSRYYAPAVAWLASSGITNGTSPTTFSPNAPVTRSQMAAFLYRYAGEPIGLPRNPFADVPRSAYFAEPVDWLFDQGITTGTSANAFSPGRYVTRAEMATFLWRLEGEPRASTAPFSDVPRGRYFSEAIDWLFERGITTGTGGRRFSPDEVVTRGQMAAFLWRLAGSPA